MKSKLWSFIDDAGTFESGKACEINTLYFPLANESFMSSVTPDLHGDAKTGQDAFLYAPVSRADLSNSRSSRNFWVRTSSGKVWSAAGVSKDLRQIKADKFKLTAGLLWHRIERENKEIGLKSDILIFVPSGGDTLEVISVTLTNVSSKTVSFIPTAAIPVYARSAENIRDHRHVTSLLNRIAVTPSGIIVKPTLLFSEAGHLVNENAYFVMGCDENSAPPEHIFPTQDMFCGDSGDLEAPEAVLDNRLPGSSDIQGREALGGFRFRRISLNPGRSCTYIMIAGIAQDPSSIHEIMSRFDSPAKIEASFSQTQGYWAGKAADHQICTANKDFDRWFKWVSVQPTLRRIFGCSFLPDFDYGKGGRGWRDLWQDCLGLILSDPHQVRELLLNNFSGVRIDGSNATIIGKDNGEFISDRNNVSRVWTDHGVWPMLTLELYINETGDYGILDEKCPYFRNHERSRSRVVDPDWKISDGQVLKTGSGEAYLSTVLEHLIVENLVQFFNVGSHNHLRLEGADWNDGLDMARQNGESVAFGAMYARNLGSLADLLEKTGRPRIDIAEEIGILLSKCDYGHIGSKHEILNKYFHATNHGVSGDTVEILSSRLAEDLRSKSSWMAGHIRKSEWVAPGFFNGYYDNDKERVEGRRANGVRMALTSQVFPVMGGIANDSQVRKVFQAAGRYLLDRKTGGYRLNTDFRGEAHNLGRAFSFAYGEKENGAFFNHMAVMFAYGLYIRGFVDEGCSVLSSISDMAMNTEASKIYPCLPEYFNSSGRGMYSYLTGSASWFVLTLLTEVFGLKGRGGDLVIEPKLCPGQFDPSGTVSATRYFAGRAFKVNFINKRKKAWGRYRISKLTVDGNAIPVKRAGAVTLGRGMIEGLSSDDIHSIEVFLG